MRINVDMNQPIQNASFIQGQAEGICQEFIERLSRLLLTDGGY